MHDDNTFPPAPQPLELSPEEMRALGYRVIDTIVDRYAGIRDLPAWGGASRAELDAVLAGPPPAGPAPTAAALDLIEQHVLPFNAKVDHPRFLAYVPGAPAWTAVLGDLLATGCNIFQGTWLSSAGASTVELTVIDWFRQWLGYGAGAAGLLVSGGSAANLTAIACARTNRFGPHHADAVIYCSAETHSSVLRAASILGFAADRVRTVDVDADERIDVAHLQTLVAGDRAASLQPFLVVANAGTTSTGAVDPLSRIAELCAREKLWLHVDAAYGGFSILTARGRTLLQGIEHADSITLDPHKWLYQTFEAGCLLVRNGALLEKAFAVMPPYLQDTALPEPAVDDAADAPRLPVNFANRGVQLTRSARALKIWLSLHTFGTDAFAAAIDGCIDLAAYAAARIENSTALELITPARLGIVCFRRRVDGDDAAHERFNALLLRALLESGTAMISSTRAHDTFALRFCVLNYRTTRADIDAVIDWIETFSERP